MPILSILQFPTFGVLSSSKYGSIEISSTQRHGAQVASQPKKKGINMLQVLPGIESNTHPLIPSSLSATITPPADSVQSREDVVRHAPRFRNVFGARDTKTRNVRNRADATG
ncbi:glutamine amidotransferase [Anopheles sinensis]|uniref:Glutamine amidotransferase n=1 Tax=Anopheles sinensis TaxID=74873 RepID=A0A084W1D0_ANOSI|nr:glutamine amidotransferase [Anopheles sinensis]